MKIIPKTIISFSLDEKDVETINEATRIISEICEAMSPNQDYDDCKYCPLVKLCYDNEFGFLANLEECNEILRNY